MNKRGTVAERFERHYIPEPNSGCWLWTGSMDVKTGYGYMGMPGGVPQRAHRVSYRLFNGEIPKGLDVRHTCDVRCCVNPDHLLVGTRKQNMDDCEARDRIARGFKLPHTRLSPEQIASILADPRKQKVIAVAYGVHNSYISMLKSGLRRHKCSC